MSEIFAVLGLGFGDEGKGTITDFLTRVYGVKLVVRHNGGPQAGHNVVTPCGKWHCFAQFGSGSFVGANTLLSRFMAILPDNMLREADALYAKGVRRVSGCIMIDKRAPIITPAHKLVCQLREVLRGKGSCGMGVGEALRDNERGVGVRISDVNSRIGLEEKIQRVIDEKDRVARELLKQAGESSEALNIYEYFKNLMNARELSAKYISAFNISGADINQICDEEVIVRAMERGEMIIFEGAQGALLDKDCGFTPHVTPSSTTDLNIQKILRPIFSKTGERQVTRVGVMRPYAHRHGAGPLVTENPRLSAVFSDPYNQENGWQGKFRFGDLDLVALRYGLEVNGGVEQLAITNLDQLSRLSSIRICTSYIYTGSTDCLNDYAEWEKLPGGKAKILALKRPACGVPSEYLTHILKNCAPGDNVHLPVWESNIFGARKSRDLPKEARKFIDFIESREGLNTPVKIVSVTPTPDGKIML